MGHLYKPSGGYKTDGEDDGDDSSMHHESIDDLMGWAKHGMAKDMAGRYGKDMGDESDASGMEEGSPEEEAGETEQEAQAEGDEGSGEDFKDVPGSDVNEEGESNDEGNKYDIDPAELEELLSALGKK